MLGFSIVKPSFSFTDVKTITIPELFTEQIAGSKNVFDSRQKQFLSPRSKIFFRNICFPRG